MADGKRIDTVTELIKNRKDKYKEIQSVMEMQEKKNQCKSGNVDKLIQGYTNGEEWDEFVGVKLYYLRKKYDSFKKMGL